MRKLLRQPGDLRREHLGSGRGWIGHGRKKRTCASCSSNFFATRGSIVVESVAVLDPGRMLVPAVLSIDPELLEFEKPFVILDELDERACRPFGSPGRAVGSGGGGIDGGGVGGGGFPF